MAEKKRIRRVAIAADLLNAILVTVSIVSFFTGTGDGNMAVAGAKCFRYFTIDSNILAAAASLILLPYLIRGRVPTWAAVLKFVGTVAVTVTFLTVVFFLGPTQGYRQMFAGVCLWLHLVCPLLAIFSLYLPEVRRPLPKKAWLFGVLPVAVYGAIYAVMLLILCRWEDFYGFNMGGFWYISLAAMLLLGALLSFVMAALQRKETLSRKR